MRYTTIILICGLVFTLIGCKKDIPKEDPEYYLGKWKLTGVHFGWTRMSEFPSPPIFDLSEKDNVYTFNKDGFMFVSGEIAELDFDSETEESCWDLYLRYGIGTGEYEYTTKMASESVDRGWCSWSLKIGNEDYSLSVWEANTSPAFSEEKTMRITKVFPYNELPWWNNMRTKTSEDMPPVALFEIYFEKVTESL